MEYSRRGGVQYSRWSRVGKLEWGCGAEYSGWSTVGGVGHLEAGDGVFSSLCEGLVDPTHDGVVGHFLPVSKLLQDVQGVSEETHRLSK